MIDGKPDIIMARNVISQTVANMVFFMGYVFWRRHGSGKIYNISISIVFHGAKLTKKKKNRQNATVKKIFVTYKTIRPASVVTGRIVE